MLRKKEARIVITFCTTTAAMQTEALARELKLSGRLIPVPREITAGCGLAWSAPPESGNDLPRLLIQKGIAVQDIYKLVI
ncbi:MAG: DUF3343 domain-containing protein [Butyricicoccus pullicaecorum]|nr:DUF3343 domain-containing protein [Butyricicoccus pullicaecorum]MDO4669499.1 DUF3343 domain-containing protein [Butyricicoccus pullicaecorum]